jgi:hypothetical protein
MEVSLNGPMKTFLYKIKMEQPLNEFMYTINHGENGWKIPITQKFISSFENKIT